MTIEIEGETYDLDLENGYYLKFTMWQPDRELNPQYRGVPDIERIGAILRCPHGNRGGLMFKQADPVYEGIFKDRNWWDVVSWEPLTINPSIQLLAPSCCHGYIREGKWVNA